MKHFAFLLIVVASVGCASSSSHPAGAQSPAKFKTTVTRQIIERYWLYLPPEYNSDLRKKWPLVIFLHGAGERGEDLDNVTTHGPAKLAERGKQFPFILISPQCPANARWNVDDLDIFLTDVLQRYRVDKDRVYLTGLSMGGWGTWQWATNYPNRFAAIVPICGAGDPFLMKKTVTYPPVWAFHGDADETVKLAETQRMIDAFKKRGAYVKLTVYPGAKHDSWTQTYENQEMWNWLLSKKRGECAADLAQ